MRTGILVLTLLVACSHCKMILMDQKFAGSLLTAKGRTYQFDAIECMVQYLEDQKQDSGFVLRVADYSNPGVMADAHSACYLVSEQVNSPMGGHLLACAHPDSCARMHERLGGTVYSWEELTKELPSP
jgi:copper chaperone NosL